MKGNITNTGYWPDSPDRDNDFNIIPSNHITMKGMDMPLLGIDNLGNFKHMFPGMDYHFPGSHVTEIPVSKQGGIFLGVYKQVGGQLVPHDISVPALQPGGSIHNVLQTAQNLYKPATPPQPSTVIRQMNQAVNTIKNAPAPVGYNPHTKYVESMASINQPFEIPDAYYNQVMQQENSIKKGYKNNKYYSYPSVEGGTPTIGFGHKLTEADVKSGKYDKGLTAQEAKTLMISDVAEHAKRANESYNKIYGEGAFDKLSPDMKLLTVDFVYNGIPVSDYPKFFGAANDYFSTSDPEVKKAAYNKMRQNSARHTGDKPLTSRNKFTNSYLEKFPEAVDYKPTPIISEKEMKTLKETVPIRKAVQTLKFQDGGDMPFGLPLKEQNIYTLPEYNQPMNPKTGEILPDPQRPNLGMDTGATEYKYTYGFDNGDVDVPSIVAGQYIGDQALDRYILTGERFKTMDDPRSYSNFYNTVNELGLMQHQKGGNVKRIKIKSLPSNWKNQ